MSKIILLFIMIFWSNSFAWAAGTALENSIKSIEKKTSAQIGVAILDLRSQELWQYNGNKPFPMMSTVKTLLCAKLLNDIAKGDVVETDSIKVEDADLVTWSPVTEKLLGQTISLTEACQAAMEMSDNTATNLVLKQLGGPMAITAFLRNLGDQSTRLDRFEPELNEAQPGDLRDTTTPVAMVNTTRKLLMESVLPVDSQKQLESWLIGNKVADTLLRSILPDGWFIADRSGAGGHGSRGIVAVLGPKREEPFFIIAIYLTQSSLNLEERNKIIVEIGQEIFKEKQIR